MVESLWERDHFNYEGKFYRVEDAVLQPKPLSKPRPPIYAGGESEAAKDLIVRKCDAYVMHGDAPDVIGGRIDDMRMRRDKLGLGPMTYGVAAYSVVRDTEAEATAEVTRITDVKGSAAGYKNYQQWLSGTQLEKRVSLEEYSVSNRGLRTGLVGMPGRVAEQVAAFEKVGVDLLLLQCSPQLEEMERFADQVIRNTR